MNELEVRGLRKSFGGVDAIQGIDFHVQGGEWVALLGPSGCGKTTTLRCVAGLEQITGGEIEIGGKVVATKNKSLPAQRRELNMVFQTYAIWPHLNVFENVAYGLRVKKVGKTETEERVKKALKMVQLSGLEDRLASRLSGGQQQRVALARAVVTEPRLILFDEPLSNLDAKLRTQMRFELLEMRERLQRPALYVTHDQAEAMVVADRIVLMNQGVIVQEGSPRELYETPVSRFAAEFIGVANFVEVTVSSIEGGSARLQVVGDQNEMVCLLDRMHESQRRVGATLDVLIRPEHIQIAGNTGTALANSWKARVVSAAYVGGHYECVFSLGRTTLKAELDSADTVKPGDELAIHVDVTRVVPLRPEGPSE